MTRALVIALLLLAATPAAADSVQLQLRDAVTVPHAGATAAFSVDPAIAEASAQDNLVTITARGVGATVVSVISGEEITPITVVVVAPPSRRRAGAAPLAHAWTTWQGHYESSSERLTNTLELVDTTPRRTLRAYVAHVWNFDAASTDAQSAIPALSLEWRDGVNEVVAFDKVIEHSPLTLDGTTVRGGHVRVHGLELHAGVTSPLVYQDVFLSTQRELVLGASYSHRIGRSTITPSVYSFPSDPATGGTSGTVGSLMYRFGAPSDRLQLRGEVGWGGRFGAAGEVSYQDAADRVWVSARHQPRGFAALGIGRPLGDVLDALWIHDAAKRVSFQGAVTAARYELPALTQELVTATGETRVKLGARLSASAGTSVGYFATTGAGDPVRSVTVPLGLHYDDRGTGGSATYRYQANSARNRGGHGGRLTGRVHRGALHGSVFVDAQQEAASLALILKAEPMLAALLNERGITVATEDDLAMLLRDQALLDQLGYVDTARIAFNPYRVQAAAELAWLSQSPSRAQLRMRVLADRTQSSRGTRDTRTASLTASRRLGDGVDAMGMLSWWMREEPLADATHAYSLAVGVRVRIAGVPRLPRWGRDDIRGTVRDERDAPLAGVTVQLDGGAVAVSDAAGRFVFRDVPRGEHRLDAESPADAYFAGASRVTVNAGESARFELVRAPARLLGTVRDEGGRPIAGVAFAVHGVRGMQTVTTDSAGAFTLAAAPGDYTVVPMRDSVPAGYAMASLVGAAVHLDAEAPVTLARELRANRSIAGTVAGGAAVVTIVELQRSVTASATGRYVFRGLPAGTYTVEARGQRRVVELPAAPTALAGIDF